MADESEQKRPIAKHGVSADLEERCAVAPGHELRDVSSGKFSIGIFTFLAEVEVPGRFPGSSAGYGDLLPPAFCRDFKIISAFRWSRMVHYGFVSCITVSGHSRRFQRQFRRRLPGVPAIL